MYSKNSPWNKELDASSLGSLSERNLSSDSSSRECRDHHFDSLEGSSERGGRIVVDRSDGGSERSEFLSD